MMKMINVSKIPEVEARVVFTKLHDDIISGFASLPF
jgi:hypothetical protein